MKLIFLNHVHVDFKIASGRYYALLTHLTVETGRNDEFSKERVKRFSRNPTPSFRIDRVLVDLRLLP